MSANNISLLVYRDIPPLDISLWICYSLKEGKPLTPCIIKYIFGKGVTSQQGDVHDILKPVYSIRLRNSNVTL